MKRIFLIFLLLLISTLSFSQRWKRYRRELVAGIGTSHYFGDIGGSSTGKGLDLDIESTRMSLLFGGRYRISETSAVKANIIYCLFHGSDVNSKNESRNFEFSSSLFETSAQFEYSIVPEKPQASYSIMDLRGGYKINRFNINTYVFGGIGTVFFSPTPMSALKDVNIGHYNKLAVTFPVGFGFKYLMDNEKSMGLEIGWRFLTTDYLDGYTSEWSNANDVYAFAQFNFTYKIRKTKKVPLF